MGRVLSKGWRVISGHAMTIIKSENFYKNKQNNEYNRQDTKNFVGKIGQPVFVVPN